MTAFGFLRFTCVHGDGRPLLASLFVLPIQAMAARFVNMPTPANEAHFFGPTER